MDKIPNGVVQDFRTKEAKAKDYPHLPAGIVLDWIEKTDVPGFQSSWKTFPNRDQWTSSSCVFQSGAKALEVLTGKILSATPYFWRKNYPTPGASLQDMADIFYNRFTTTEALSTSQLQNEVTMNKIKQLTTNVGITGYRTIFNLTFDNVAEAVAQYGQCVVSFGSRNDEWTLTPKFNGKNAEWWHAICAVDYGLKDYGLKGRVKVLRCEDSTGKKSSPDGTRWITEEFFNERATGAVYFLGAKDVSIPQDETQTKIALLTKLLELYKQLLAKLRG
jgi:hypothetical protein